MVLSAIKIYFYRILLFLFLFPFTLFAQETTRATGKATVKIESNMTKDQAKDIAREMAMINAIENELGTYVEQATDIRVDEGKVQYNIIGTTKVKGDWIRTIDESFTEEDDASHDRTGQKLENYIVCKITGEVRKATAKPMILYQTLNCPEPGCRQTEFFSGESMYLFFKSPVDGYLSVFLDDGERVYRLFPYTSMTGKQYSAGFINGDKDYILFSKKKNDTPFIPDEFELYSIRQAAEFNNIYVIFSTDPFEKPILEESTSKLPEGTDFKIPKSLTYKDFNKWLAHNRSILPGFIDSRIKVTIVQKN